MQNDKRVLVKFNKNKVEDSLWISFINFEPKLCTGYSPVDTQEYILISLKDCIKQGISFLHCEDDFYEHGDCKINSVPHVAFPKKWFDILTEQ